MQYLTHIPSVITEPSLSLSLRDSPMPLSLRNTSRSEGFCLNSSKYMYERVSEATQKRSHRNISQPKEETRKTGRRLNFLVSVQNGVHDVSQVERALGRCVWVFHSPYTH